MGGSGIELSLYYIGGICALFFMSLVNNIISDSRLLVINNLMSNIKYLLIEGLTIADGIKAEFSSTMYSAIAFVNVYVLGCFPYKFVFLFWLIIKK